VVRDYVENYIYQPDRERYQRFIDIDTMTGRILRNKNQTAEGRDRRAEIIRTSPFHDAEASGGCPGTLLSSDGQTIKTAAGM
jgi:hypothetical protein